MSCIDLLALMSIEVKRHGSPPKTITFDFESEESADTKEVLAAFPGITYDQIITKIKEAIALEYIERQYIGSSLTVRMTTKGFGAGHSHNQTIQSVASLSSLEKISHWAEKNSALTNLVFGIFGILIGVAGTLFATK